jgi:endonuclease YncB( thermonuclease family)
VKHWRPEDEFVPLRPADRRKWTKNDGSGPARNPPGPEPAHVGLALVAAACFGLSYAFYEAVASGDPFASAEAPATIPYFGDCPSGGRNCVVSGDTFDLGGETIRIAGIEAPQLLAARCPAEQRLGQAAAHHLRELLNSGQLTLASAGGLKSRSGSVLRVVRVDGRDLGRTLVEEKLAVPYTSGTRPWCRPRMPSRSITKPA